MSASKIEWGGTAGPWVVNPFRAWIECPDLCEDGKPLPVAALAWPTEYRSEAETQMNGRAISEVPAMVALLREFSVEYDGFEDGNGEPDPVLMMARAILARIDGEVPHV